MKLSFHDLQLQFVRTMVTDEEMKKYHCAMIRGYNIETNGTFFDFPDYFLYNFHRHLNDGNLVDVTKAMAINGGLCIELHKRTTYKSYLVELLELAVKKSEDELPLKILREQEIESDGTSLLFTLSIFMDSSSQLISSMKEYLAKENEPILIADFIHEKEKGGTSCLENPEVVSKVITCSNNSGGWIIVNHDFQEIAYFECLRAIPSEDSTMFGVTKEKKGPVTENEPVSRFLEVINMEETVIHNVELTFDWKKEMCRSIDNHGNYATFYSYIIEDSYLIDIHHHKTFRLKGMGCKISGNGKFFVVHADKRIWVIRVDWLEGRETDIVVDDLEKCSYEFEELVNKIFLSDDKLVARFSIDTMIIDINSNLSLGSIRSVKGVAIAAYSNCVVTTKGTFSLNDGTVICPIGLSYPLESSKGSAKWMRMDFKSERLVPYQEMPKSDDSWHYSESEKLLALYNANVVKFFEKDNLEKNFETDKVQNIRMTQICDKYACLQTNNESVFIFDIERQFFVNIGEKEGHFSFSSDCKYLIFYAKEGVDRLEMDSIESWSENLDSKSFVSFENFNIVGVSKSDRYPILNNILSYSDGKLYKHPVDNPSEKHYLVEWEYTKPSFTYSPSRDQFCIYCDDTSSVVFDGYRCNIVQRGHDLTSCANVTVVNAIYFLTVISPRHPFELRCPFTIDHVLTRSDGKIVLCIGDKMETVTVSGPVKERAKEFEKAEQVEIMKTFFA